MVNAYVTLLNTPFSCFFYMCDHVHMCVCVYIYIDFNFFYIGNYLIITLKLILV